MNFGAKLALFIAACVPILFLGFIGVIITGFSGLIKFYLPLVIVITVGVLFFVCNGIFKFLKPKALKVTFIGFFSLCIVAIIVHESINVYVNSLGSLEDAEVDLTEYEPFGDESKVVSLDEESTLKLEDNLPRLDGATALYPVYSAFAQATYPEGIYNVYKGKVIATKTPHAYENLINGDVDMIFVAGPSERQLRYAEQKGVELKLTPIGREAFVFFVNAKNPVDSLTVDQIKDIYSGKITNWSDVGGKNDRIRAFQRPEDSGSQTALQNFMGTTPIMDPPKEDVASGMGGIIEQTANYTNYKNAIGYSFRYFSMDMVRNDKIKHVAINGIYPTKETIRNGEYPIADQFYVVTAGTDNPNVDRFIEWILSEQGQSLVEKTGYVPVSE
ncbi:phosphate transport system substrate-binding protein [Salirhabdus euzebyi]|uniref:Phosphate transport system substrate-binding protein n=1 Tax=Salirhabdus euzebyi TaxID=394506 RepID=A0A841Q1A9_9BACI|nr:substrate-binding domain-containing protein [Salirhabdus euzebyi]MBB6451742.1 phosphate transport system substrate-binding protein [Salirhabdus euzebyi]